MTFWTSGAEGVHLTRGGPLAVTANFDRHQLQGEQSKRYMFLIYSRETDRTAMSPADMDELKEAHWAVIDKTRAKGIFHGAEPLHSTVTATTVRLADGKPLVFDGPYAETKEQLAGYTSSTAKISTRPSAGRPKSRRHARAAKAASKFAR